MKSEKKWVKQNRSCTIREMSSYVTIYPSLSTTTAMLQGILEVHHDTNAIGEAQIRSRIIQLKVITLEVTRAFERNSECGRHFLVSIILATVRILIVEEVGWVGGELSECDNIAKGR